MYTVLYQYLINFDSFSLVQPFSCRWIMRGFSGHLPPEQLLFLWDLVLAYDSMEVRKEHFYISCLGFRVQRRFYAFCYFFMIWNKKKAPKQVCECERLKNICNTWTGGVRREAYFVLLYFILYFEIFSSCPYSLM